MREDAELAEHIAEQLSNDGKLVRLD
jgi:hypothetical protein